MLAHSRSMNVLQPSHSRSRSYGVSAGSRDVLAPHDTQRLKRPSPDHGHHREHSAPELPHTRSRGPTPAPTRPVPPVPALVYSSEDASSDSSLDSPERDEPALPAANVAEFSMSSLVPHSRHQERPADWPLASPEAQSPLATRSDPGRIPHMTSSKSLKTESLKRKEPCPSIMSRSSKSKTVFPQISSCSSGSGGKRFFFPEGQCRGSSAPCDFSGFDQDGELVFDDAVVSRRYLKEKERRARNGTSPSSDEAGPSSAASPPRPSIHRRNKTLTVFESFSFPMPPSPAPALPADSASSTTADPQAHPAAHQVASSRGTKLSPAAGSSADAFVLTHRTTASESSVGKRATLKHSVSTSAMTTHRAYKPAIAVGTSIAGLNFRSRSARAVDSTNKEKELWALQHSVQARDGAVIVSHPDDQPKRAEVVRVDCHATKALSQHPNTSRKDGVVVIGAGDRTHNDSSGAWREMRDLISEVDRF